MNALLLHRIHFGFNATFHYIFPQLTMGLALLLVVLKTVAVRRHDERYNDAARFWARIFAINFLLGVVTGVPMEFQFGTNWSQFARTTGGGPKWKSSVCFPSDGLVVALTSSILFS
jgi:cytochrome bd ubiquinol oxidase subunit I